MEVKNKNISETVIRALCKSLALDPGEVRDDSRLINDLGMDSLDFLDVMFTLEKSLGINIRDDFDRVLRPDRSEAAAPGEFLTKEEIDELASIIPSLLKMGQVPREALFSFITVETLVRIIDRKLNKP